jgi:hypothetical protein
MQRVDGTVNRRIIIDNIQRAEIAAGIVPTRADIFHFVNAIMPSTAQTAQPQYMVQPSPLAIVSDHTAPLSYMFSL